MSPTIGPRPPRSSALGDTARDREARGDGGVMTIRCGESLTDLARDGTPVQATARLGRRIID